MAIVNIDCGCCGDKVEKLLRELIHVERKNLDVATATLRVEHEQLKVLRDLRQILTPHTASIGIDFSPPTPK